MIRIKIDVGQNGVVLRDDREYRTVLECERRYRAIQKAFPEAAITVWEVTDGNTQTQLTKLFT